MTIRASRDGDFRTPVRCCLGVFAGVNTAPVAFTISLVSKLISNGASKNVFQMIPGFENASFIHYGVVHRNSYMDSPNLLNQTFQSRSNPNLFFAGQMTGVEGYVESAPARLVAGINAVKRFKEEAEVIFLRTTAIGSLPYYITHTESKHFQPMNVNFGIIKELEGARLFAIKKHAMKPLLNVL